MPTFLLPSQAQTQYFNILKSIKPTININDKTSDFVIRGKVFAAFASGLYGDQAQKNNDTFITSSSAAALSLHGQDLAITQSPATSSSSDDIQVNGTNGTVIGIGDLTFQYPATGVTYTNTTGGTVGSGVLHVKVVANTTGQIGNVVAPDTLQIISPPAGIQPTANVVADIANGADAESTDSYRSRLLNRLQQPPAGGNQNDYRNFAFAADPSVRTALVRRFGRGLGTVDIYITTGTTDIDTAVTQGLSIVRIPSGGLIDTVQAYYDANDPLTDCATVYPPIEALQDATMKVDLAAGITLSTVPSDPVNNPLGLTVSQLIVREMGRPIYKVPVGGWKLPGHLDGFVVAAYIEQSFDVWLSAEIDQNTGLAIGKIPVIADRQILPLDGSNYDQVLAGNNIVNPGTMTVIQGV